MGRKKEGIHVRVNSYGPGRPLMMVYTDPISNKKVAKSTGIIDTGKKARSDAAKEAGKWEEELNSGRYKAPSKVTWAEFRKRYEEERYPSLAEGTQETSATAFNHVERVLDPDRLAKLTTANVGTFIRRLREEGMKDSTLACHLRHLKAALNWAVKMEIMAEVPNIEMPRAGEAKGRPITAEEFDRMTAAAVKVRPQDHAAWTRLLTGLWFSGLRLEESLILSWDQEEPFIVDLSGKFPQFRIEAKAQKARRSEKVPMTPDFADWILQTREADRSGRVFPMPSLLDGQPLTSERVGKIISKIGKKAGVIVARETVRDRNTGKDVEKIKYASAHDLRRSFATRLAKSGTNQFELMKMMRHASITTTQKYYVDIEADDIAEKLWAKHPTGGNGNTSGNNRPAIELSQGKDIS